MNNKKRIKLDIQAKQNEDTYILTLSGDVTKPSEFDYGEIYADLVRYFLDGITSDIIIRLNSYGGNIFEGIEIYNYLKAHPSHITVEITGIAASAASVLALGANKVLMNVGSQFMIHRASTGVWGNDEELEKVVAMLKVTNGSMVDIYADKSEQSNEQIIEWMEKETFFSAEETVQFGFADGMKEIEPSVGDMSAKVEPLVLANQIGPEDLDKEYFLNHINEQVAKAVAEATKVVETPEESEDPKSSILENLLKNI